MIRYQLDILQNLHNETIFKVTNQEVNYKFYKKLKFLQSRKNYKIQYFLQIVKVKNLHDENITKYYKRIIKSNISYKI